MPDERLVARSFLRRFPDDGEKKRKGNTRMYEILALVREPRVVEINPSPSAAARSVT